MNPQNPALHSLLTKGVSCLIDGEKLQKKLESGQTIRVKFGIDPSGTIVHLGHMVPFLKLRQFQDMGCEIILLIGDATAQVGDASDKEAERPMLTRAETKENARAFLQKFARVLDMEKVNIYYNSEGLDVVNFCAVGELAKHFSVAEMLDRDNFSKRYKGGVRISLQEFLYPIMQGYDSVAIARKYGSCDVEIGGNDQYFNIMAGRTLMEAHGMDKQTVMTFELLIGPDGKKMSKTSPNTIAVDEAPQSMYQKLINISDDLIVKYFELATTATPEAVAQVQSRLDSGEHPNILKEELAQTIVTMYHGKAYDPSDRENIELVRMTNDEGRMTKNQISISDLLKTLDFCATSGDVRNALSGGSVRVDGVVITDSKTLISLSTDTEILIEIGKKKAKRVVMG